MPDPPTTEDVLVSVTRSLDAAVATLPPAVCRVVGDAVAGGKRLRPLLLWSWFRACGGRGDDWLPPALAVELVHRASLAHDDLPALDDDDERDGDPTVHVRHGAASALLAGDAMMALAFRGLAGAREPARMTVELAETVAAMCDGQIDDVLAGAGAERDWDDVCDRKTGRLFAAAARLGVLAAAVPDPSAEAVRLDAATTFGRRLGRLYQLQDDIADGDRHPDGRDPVGPDAWSALRDTASSVDDPSPVAAFVDGLRSRLASSHSSRT